MQRIKMIHCLSNFLRYRTFDMHTNLRKSASRMQIVQAEMNARWEFENYRVDEDRCPSGTNKLW